MNLTKLAVRSTLGATGLGLLLQLTLLLITWDSPNDASMLAWPIVLGGAGLAFWVVVWSITPKKYWSFDF